MLRGREGAGKAPPAGPLMGERTCPTEGTISEGLEEQQFPFGIEYFVVEWKGTNFLEIIYKLSKNEGRHQ